MHLVLQPFTNIRRAIGRLPDTIATFGALNPLPFKYLAVLPIKGALSMRFIFEKLSTISVSRRVDLITLTTSLVVLPVALVDATRCVRLDTKAVPHLSGVDLPTKQGLFILLDAEVWLLCKGFHVKQVRKHLEFGFDRAYFRVHLETLSCQLRFHLESLLVVLNFLSNQRAVSILRETDIHFIFNY